LYLKHINKLINKQEYGKLITKWIIKNFENLILNGDCLFYFKPSKVLGNIRPARLEKGQPSLQILIARLPRKSRQHFIARHFFRCTPISDRSSNI
jgi:hypothetical protein